MRKQLELLFLVGILGASAWCYVFPPETHEHAVKVCRAEQAIGGHASPECVHLLALEAVAAEAAEAARHAAECAKPYDTNDQWAKFSHGRKCDD